MNGAFSFVREMRRIRVLFLYVSIVSALRIGLLESEFLRVLLAQRYSILCSKIAVVE